MKRHQWHAGLERAEYLPDVSHLGTRGKEYDGLRSQVGFDKGVHGIQLVFQRYRHDGLFQSLWSLAGFLVVHAEVLRPVQAQRGEVRHALRLRRGEQHGLPAVALVVVVLLLAVISRGQIIQYPYHLIPESHVQYPIGLVEHEHANPIHLESRGLFQMLEQSTGRGDDDIHSGEVLLLQSVFFLTPHQQARRKIVVRSHRAEDLKCLHGQFARGGEDDGAGSVRRGALTPKQFFEERDKEG
mmetsp:Transcript_39724/g.95558  ORF Transcript_39724/g.95558 Transcript_39724/m.95558 type:complete len:241 (+) Transcript_39724:1426-2148(+)